jgi:hypothetical protein
VEPDLVVVGGRTPPVDVDDRVDVGAAESSEHKDEMGMKADEEDQQQSRKSPRLWSAGG